MSVPGADRRVGASDEELKKALEDAFLPPLLPALAQATGDVSILEPDLLPQQIVPGGMAQAGMTEAQQARARELALGALRRLRDAGKLGDGEGRNGDVASEQDLRAIIDWMTRGNASDEYLPLLIEELDPANDDPRRPQWKMEPGTQFRVAVVGAGMSGILAAIRCKQAGIPVTLFEKNADVGGTWFENTYPGARVDVPNLFYSYSFAQKTDWPKYFSTQDIILDYLRGCADEYGIREDIRFNTEVTSATFDEERALWTLRLRTPAGGEETVEANAIVCATGQLNRPKMPQIEGMSAFEGPSFHSSQWAHDVDLKDKRVAVIGNGASAAQFIPAIAPEVSQLYVFQRTPNWFVPVPQYHDDIPEGLRWLLRNVPYYAHWYRFYLFWTSSDGLLAAATVDESWPHKDRSVSQENEALRMLLAGYLQAQFGDRPDLLEKVMPSYPPGAKRMILDNGVWAAALKRDNVELVTEAIERISPSGVVTADGAERTVDVIIYGTGFRASHFMAPMRVIGRHGIDLNEQQWCGDARAYMGVVVPNFPNFFMLYGPNTNIVVNSSIIYFSECEVQYLMGCLRLVLERKHRALDPRQDVHDEYNRKIDEANRLRAWGASGVPSWYKNDLGRVSQNWPFNAASYWQQTREPDPGDFVFL